MHKFIGIIFMAAILSTFSGCGSESEKSISTKSTSQIVSSVQQNEIKFSENILFSINNGAAGFGTVAECTDAEIFVYTDGSIKIFMVTSDYSAVTEIGSVVLSEEDYKKIAELADREKIYNLQVEDGEGEDGNSSHITLYDEKDNELVSKGGYLPVGEEFCEMYRSIKEILQPYGISEIVDAHRKTLEP